MSKLDEALEACPLIAILRGIQPDEVAPVSDILVAAGWRIIEIPLNSPEPLRSIEILAGRHGDSILVGAGTVMTPDDCMPGVTTPTEGFAALTSGADALKMFPAESMPPAIVKAWRAVFPRESRLLPVGGIDAGNIAAYRAAGASGFGIGSALFAPGRELDDIRRRAESLVAAVAT